VDVRVRAPRRAEQRATDEGNPDRNDEEDTMAARPAAKAAPSKPKKVDGRTASPYGYPFWDWVAQEDPDYVIARKPLTDLSVEVKLERRGGGTDLRTVPVSPSEIAPGAQGTFQFELDGKQYARYGVNRLLAKNGSEMKFVKPNQETQTQTKSQ